MAIRLFLGQNSFEKKKNTLALFKTEVLIQIINFPHLITLIESGKNKIWYGRNFSLSTCNKHRSRHHPGLCDDSILWLLAYFRDHFPSWHPSRVHKSTPESKSIYYTREMMRSFIISLKKKGSGLERERERESERGERGRGRKKKIAKLLRDFRVW